MHSIASEMIIFCLVSAFLGMAFEKEFEHFQLIILAHLGRICCQAPPIGCHVKGHLFWDDNSAQ